MQSISRACILAAMLLVMACVGNSTIAASTSSASGAGAPVRVAPKLMLNVGDSITEGFVDQGNYTYRLNRSLSMDKWVVFPAGRSGAAISHLSRRYWPKTAQAYWAMKTQPDMVTIMLGTNDARPGDETHPKWVDVEPTFNEDAAKLIQSFRAMPSHPEVFLVTPPPASDDNRYTIKGTLIRDQVTPRLMQVADQEMTGVIDVWNTALLDATGDGTAVDPKGSKPTAFYQDGVHPTMKGYGVIADKMAMILKTPRPKVQADGRHLTCSAQAATYQWFLDGKKVAANQGGQMRDLVATEPGQYAVAIWPNAKTMDRLVSASVDVK